jgi:hypothetical protein
MHQNAIQGLFQAYIYLRSFSVSANNVLTTDFLDLDPESYVWHQIDSDMLQRMSNRKYLLMSLETQYNLPVDPAVFLQSDSRTSSNFSQELALGSKAFASLSNYVTPPDHTRKPAKPWSSAFEAGTPGVMPLEAVEHDVDLGRWKLKLRGRIIYLEVSCEALFHLDPEGPGAGVVDAGLIG